MVAHTFNPSIQEAETRGSLEFEVSLVYRVSSRTARTAQRNHVSKDQKQNKTQKPQNKKMGSVTQKQYSKHGSREKESGISKHNCNGKIKMLQDPQQQQGAEML